MKKSADITMRGQCPERQEMLQLEAAMSASYSHKPPPLFLLNQHIWKKSFQFWAKTFHGFGKKARRFQLQTLFCLLDLVEMFIFESTSFDFKASLSES